MTEKKLSPLVKQVLIDVVECVGVACAMAWVLVFPFAFWWVIWKYVIQP